MIGLSAYLPVHAREMLARSKPAPEPPHLSRQRGALLLCDLSNFTSTTERLQARGKSGAEEISAVVNSVFHPAVLAIDRRGGSIIGFGGDSIFAFFPGETPVTRAQLAADAIAALQRRRPTVATSQGPLPLSMKQVIHYGTVDDLHLGHTQRRHYLMSGVPLRTLARMEEMILPGAIRLSRAARTQQRRERTIPPRSQSRRRARPTDLRRYVPPRLLPLIRDFDGELRQAAVLAFETRARSPARLQEFFLTLVSLLDDLDGVLIKTDLSTHGTKWMCVFGLPRAHEDDAERAARLALRLHEQSSIPSRGGLAHGRLAAIRVGNHIRANVDVMGDVVNSAFRTMEAAPWGETQSTGAQFAELSDISTEFRGWQSVRGKAEPLQMYALVGTDAGRRSNPAQASFVGRGRELRSLRRAITAAASGHGAAVGIRGAAGIGKTRLSSEAASIAESSGLLVARTRSQRFGTVPYGPVRDLLKSLLRLPQDATAKQISQTIEAMGDWYELSAIEQRHVADVLGARDERSALRFLSGKAIRHNNAAAVTALLGAMASRQPLMLIFDDLSWADEMTLEVVTTLAMRLDSLPILLLALYRPEPPLSPPWTELPLRRLSRTAIDTIVQELLGKGSSRREVCARAAGNPLFAEQLARHVTEAGPRAGEMPMTLEAILASQLDRLSVPARRLAQAGAVLGMSFDPDVCRRVDPALSSLPAAMLELRTRGIVTATGVAGSPFRFSHTLLRDVAYGRVLMARRRKMHRAAARALEPMCRRGDVEPAAVAAHWDLAGDAARASGFHLLAARQATSRDANREAERHFRKYLDGQPGVTAESARARADLADVLDLLGRGREALAEHRRAVSQMERLGTAPRLAEALRGMGRTLVGLTQFDEARRVYQRALRLHRIAGDRSEEGATIGHLARLELHQGNAHRAVELLRQAVALHRRHRKRRWEAVALGNLGTALGQLGRVADAREHLERALEIARDEGDRRNEAVRLDNLAVHHDQQGRVRTAEKLYSQALSVHQDIGDRRGEAVSLINVAQLHFGQGRLETTRRLTRRALRICRELNDRALEATSLSNLALTLPAREKRRMLKQALQLHRELGNRREEGIALLNLGNTYQQPEKAWPLFRRALAIHRAGGDTRYEALTLCDYTRSRLMARGPGTGLRRDTRRALRLARALNEPAVLTEALCVDGHLRLALGGSIEDHLTELRALDRPQPASPGGDWVRSIEHLRKARRARDRGHDLHHGFARSSVPAAILRFTS